MFRRPSRLGGRWAVSARVYWISAPIIIGFSLLTENGALASWQAFGQWAVIQLLGYAAIGGVLLVADRTVLRHRREHPVPAWVVVTVGALAGVARGAVTAAMIDVLGVTSANSIGVRLVMGAVLGAFWLTGVAKIMADLEDVRVEYRQLLAAQVANHRRLQITERERAEITAALAQQVGGELATSLSGSVGEDRTRHSVNLAETAERLEQLAGPVRELSHRLWRQEAALPVASDAQLLKYAMTGSVVRPRWSLAFFSVLGVVALGRTHGWVEAVVISGTYAVSVLLAARVINSFAASGRYEARQLIVVSVIAALLVPLPFVIMMVLFGLPTASVLADWVASLMYTVLVIPLASSVLSPVTRRRIALEAMRQQITEDDLRTIALAHEHASLCRALARHLHGTVQADLYAASLRLSAGLDAGAAGSWASVSSVQELATLLTRPEPGGSAAAETTLGPHLGRLAAQWQGIVDITIEVDPTAQEIDLGSRVCQDVVAMLTEVVHDALHHGSATTITVRAAADDEAVRVTTENDGSPFDDASTPGLGTALLDHCAADWSRRPKPDGTGAIVRFAIPRTDSRVPAGSRYASPRSANS